MKADSSKKRNRSTFSHLPSGIAILVSLSGCTTGPFPEAPAAKPPVNYHQLAKNALRGSLKNPFDVKDVKMSNLTKIQYDYNQTPKWTVCVSLYARNGFNALTPGAYYVAFTEGVVSKIVSISDYGFIKSQVGSCGPMKPVLW